MFPISVLALIFIPFGLAAKAAGAPVPKWDFPYGAKHERNLLVLWPFLKAEKPTPFNLGPR
jgi:hypothetical protein